MPVPRPALVLAAGAVVAGLVAAGVAAGGGDGGPAAPAGPTAAASVRDLVTNLETTGRVERAWERTVSYAAAVPRPSAGGSAPPAQLGDGATATTPAALTPAATQEAAPAEEAAPAAVPEPTTPTTVTDATTAPAGGEQPAATTTSTTAPPVTAPPVTSVTSPPAGDRTAQPPPTTSAGTTTPTTAPAPQEEDEDPAVLTAIAPLGADVGNGTVLYSADDEPVVALTGAVPAWRTLEAGVDGGADVRQLEEALVALGHGAGLTVDDEFTGATTAAVKRWETALGRAEPDGVVEVGDVVFVAEPGTVLARRAAVGDPLEAGTPVVVIGSTSQHLSAVVAAGEAAGWAAGTPVGLTWSDGSTTTGTVAATGREVSDGTVELTVSLSDADAARPTGAEATIAAVEAHRAGAVTVPVAALVAGPDGAPAVRRPARAGRPDRVVAVTTGIVSGTWVEVVTGLAAGDTVRLPG